MNVDVDVAMMVSIATAATTMRSTGGGIASFFQFIMASLSTDCEDNHVSGETDSASRPIFFLLSLFLWKMLLFI